MQPFHFIPLKYQDFREEEVEFKNQKGFFKSIKNILVLNVAFSKSVLVLVKKMGVDVFEIAIVVIKHKAMFGTVMIEFNLYDTSAGKINMKNPSHFT